MAGSSRFNSRNNFGLSFLEKFQGSILTPIIAGLLMGVGAFLLKVVMGSVIIDINIILSLILSPTAWLGFITSGLGFLLFQLSLYKGKVSVITPITGGLATVIPIILAIAFLSELLSTLKIVGIILIVIGIIALRD